MVHSAASATAMDLAGATGAARAGMAARVAARRREVESCILVAG